MNAIILFNLNSYLGGGEVLVIRLAEELKRRKCVYKIVCMPKSYIQQECEKNGLEYVCWTVPNDSVLYMNAREKKQLVSFMQELVEPYQAPLIYTFCFRDVYNILFLKGKLGKRVYVGTGIYHPDDTKYVATRTCYCKKNKKLNRMVLQQYCDANSAIFMNERVYASSVVKCEDYILIPLPIRRVNTFEKRNEKNEYNKIIWIGRFVDFKLAAIANIIAVAQENLNIQLTILGYGPGENTIKKLIRKQPGNIKLIGKTNPEKLEKIIKQHDIGYAMGTSILECAACGIPVIKAAAMPQKMIGKYRDVCAGIFAEVKDYNVGEMDIGDESMKYSLRECISKIQENYAHYSQITNTFIEEFELENVMDKYLKVWENMFLDLNDIDYQSPRISIVRYIVKRAIYNIFFKRYD